MKVLKKHPRTYTFLINYLGGVLTLEQSIKITGKELFTLVCTCLGIVEYWYFGLQFESSKKQSKWIHPNTKVYSLVKKTGAPLFFLIKYFPDEIGRVAEDMTLSFIYKQCKGSIISGAIFCTPETSILLASYNLQSDYGDWSCVDYKSLNMNALIPSIVLEQYNMPHRNWSESLRNWHKDHRGLSKKESQLEYLRIAQCLGMYGVNYFPTKWQGEPAWIGVHPRGINIYVENILVPQTSLKWIFIRMVHYSCHKFIIRTVLSQVPEYVFNMKTLHLTKQVFEFAVGYHNLYQRSRSLSSTEVNSLSGKFSLEPEKFKEVTEEICRNDTTESSGIFIKISKRMMEEKRHLPSVDEEEEALI